MLIKLKYILISETSSAKDHFNKQILQLGECSEGEGATEGENSLSMEVKHSLAGKEKLISEAP